MTTHKDAILHMYHIVNFYSTILRELFIIIFMGIIYFIADYFITKHIFC